MVAQTDVWGKWRGDGQSVCPRCWSHWRGTNALSFEQRTLISQNTLKLRTLDCVHFAHRCLPQLERQDLHFGSMKIEIEELFKKLRKLLDSRDKSGTGNMDKRKHKFETDSCVSKKETKNALAAVYFIECTRRRLSLEPELNDYYAVVNEIMSVLRVW